MEKLLIGVYETHDEVVQAVEELKRQGYDTADISVIGKNTGDVNKIIEATGTKTEEGLATGAVTGGAIGGVLGVLAGIGALPIPEIGLDWAVYCSRADSGRFDWSCRWCRSRRLGGSTH